jgi:hypothetical protein
MKKRVKCKTCHGKVKKKVNLGILGVSLMFQRGYPNHAQIQLLEGNVQNDEGNMKNMLFYNSKIFF